jgi:hypothetical protein
VTLSLLVISGPEPLPASGAIDIFAGVWARNNASVFIFASVIQGHRKAGLMVSGGASVTTDRVAVQNNAGDGVVASDNGSIVLDTRATTRASSVTANGGRGVFADRGGRVSILGVPTARSAVSGNGLQAVLAVDAASVRIIDGDVESLGIHDAVVALGGSSAYVQDSLVTSATGTGVLALDTAHVTLRGTSVSSSGAVGGGAAVVAAVGSSARLIGGNTLVNVSGGAALSVLESASFISEDGAERTTTFVPRGLNNPTFFAAAPNVIDGPVFVRNLSMARFVEGTITGDVTVGERSTLRLDKTGTLALQITGKLSFGFGAAGFFTGPAGSIVTSAAATCADAETSVAGVGSLSAGAIGCTGF